MESMPCHKDGQAHVLLSCSIPTVFIRQVGASLEMVCYLVEEGFRALRVLLQQLLGDQEILSGQWRSRRLRVLTTSES
jgi:hypothetical protein